MNTTTGKTAAARIAGVLLGLEGVGSDVGDKDGVANLLVVEEAEAEEMVEGVMLLLGMVDEMEVIAPNIEREMQKVVVTGIVSVVVL